MNQSEIMHFLDLLDPGGRHYISTKAEFFEGQTFEFKQRSQIPPYCQKLERRELASYVSINEPIEIWSVNAVRSDDGSRFSGKYKESEICSLRSLAFDIDLNAAACGDPVSRQIAMDTAKEWIEQRLSKFCPPTIITMSGGGYQIWYIFQIKINVQRFYGKVLTSAQLNTNAAHDKWRMLIKELWTDIDSMFKADCAATGVDKFFKFDNMMNTDRVMRLPGTINFSTPEKMARFQAQCQSFIVSDAGPRWTYEKLRSMFAAPPDRESKKQASAQLAIEKERALAARKPVSEDQEWRNTTKARWLCQFIKDNGLADEDAVWSMKVCLPLKRLVNDTLDIVDEGSAIEYLLTAVSGGARYGTAGRGDAHFLRKWHSTYMVHKAQEHSAGDPIGVLYNLCREYCGDRFTALVPWSQEFRVNDAITNWKQRSQELDDTMAAYALMKSEGEKK